MGIIEKLNQYPKATTAAVSAVVVVALSLSLSSLRGDAAARGGLRQAFFSVDDGATYFADEASKAPGSFSRDGKPAYRAYVFRAGGGRPFVGYLERHNPETPAQAAAPAAAAAAEANDAKSRSPSAMRGASKAKAAGQGAPASLAEVKKPGAAGAWTRLTDPAAAGVLRVTSPEGRTDGLEPVLPGRD